MALNVCGSNFWAFFPQSSYVQMSNIILSLPSLLLRNKTMNWEIKKVYRKGTESTPQRRVFYNSAQEHDAIVIEWVTLITGLLCFASLRVSLFHLSIVCCLIEKYQDVLISIESDCQKNHKNQYPARKTTCLQSQMFLPVKYEKLLICENKLPQKSSATH